MFLKSILLHLNLQKSQVSLLSDDIYLIPTRLHVPSPCWHLANYYHNFMTILRFATFNIYKISVQKVDKSDRIAQG